MNIVRNTLTHVFGKNVPKTATSFYTSGNLIVFNLKSGKCKFVNMKIDQVYALEREGLLGLRGWAIQ